MKKQVIGLLFASPAIIYIAVFFLYPFLLTAYLSLTEYPLISAPTFVGLDNFVRIFTRDATFGDSLYATAIYAIGFCLGIWILAPATSLFFNNKFKGRGVYVVIFMIAAMLGVVPAAMAWKVMLHPSLGIFNKLFFYSWGFTGQVDWFSSVSLAMPGMIMVTLVSGIPFYSIYLIGALGGIPSHYSAVAKIGGASLFQRLRYVVLPSIKPIYLFVIVTSLISSFQMVSWFFLLTNGGPVNVTRVLSLYIYNAAFYYYQFGYAAALTLVLLGISGVLCYFAIKVMNK
jgi:multiple sugar transport system permease protein